LFFLVVPATVALGQSPTESAPAAKSNLGEMVKLVPDDVALVVVLRDFGELVDGLQEFGAVIGVDDLIEIDADELFDDLEVRELAGGWEDRIRKDGPLVFALTEPDAEPLIICTVTEPASVPSNELVQFRGQVMVSTPDAEIMRAVNSAGGKFAQRFDIQVRAALENHDVAVFVDVPAWSVQIEQMLSVGEMFSQMGAAAATPETQVNLTMVNWLFQGLRTGLDESESIVIAGRVNGDGVHLSELTHFDRSGKVARYLSKVGKPDTDPLRGLVAEPGMIVMASEWTLPGDAETLTEQLLEVLLAAGSEPADAPAEWKTTTQRALKLYRVIAGYNGVMSFNTDPPGMTGSGLYFAADPRAVFDGFPALWRMSGPMMSAMAPGFSMDVSERTETVGSVEARVYRFAFDATDEEMQLALRRMYGDSTTVYVAPHPEGVAYAMGSAEVARRDLEKLLARKGGPLRSDQRIADALKMLSPKPQALVLLDVPRMIEWGTRIADVPVVEIPKLDPTKAPLPYVSFGLYLDESACRAELFVPARAVRVVVDLSKGPGAAAGDSDPY
jgi:hypothetical protein